MQVIWHNDSVGYAPAHKRQIGPCSEHALARSGQAEGRETFASIEILLARQEILTLELAELRRGWLKAAQVRMNLPYAINRGGWQGAGGSDRDEMRATNDLPMEQA